MIGLEVAVAIMISGPFVPIITGQPILRLLFMMMPTELTGLEPPLEIELAFGCFTQCGVGEIKFLKIKS
jgi:hypothetical protein